MTADHTLMEDKSQEKLNEAELVERAKTNDQAFKELYDKYFPRIYQFILKRVSHQETAEDLMSETFMKAFTNLQKYEFKGYTFGAWLYRIAGNVVIDYYRKEYKYKMVDIEDYERIADDKTPDQDVQQLQDRQQIEKLLDTLPQNEREIIELKFFAELSNQEIAEALNIKANHAGVIIYRALKKLSKNNPPISILSLFLFI